MSGLTRDDIIRIYMQVSDELCGGTEWCWAGVGEPLQRFAALVAAAERDACAKLCDAHKNPIDDPTAPVGQYESGGYIMAEFLADAIRARGQQ